MFFEALRIFRFSHTIKNPTTGANVRHASVSCHEIQKAPPRHAIIFRGSVIAPPKVVVIPPESISAVWVT